MISRGRLRFSKWAFAGLLAACLCAGTGIGVGAEKAGSKIDFDRQIRPLLSENCFACHGPDENKRKAGLRLDLKEDAFKELKSGDRAIVPGDVKNSQLVQRITTKDEDDRMPPLKTGKHLTPGQIDLLTRWVAEGAEWKAHWAYVKPERPAVPQTKSKRWAKNGIDSFVMARLEKEGLPPSPEADKATLARRATLDLTGLPPTPAEVDAFLADKSPTAYEKLVDRLLESPRYGEQMAHYWLDAVRYADSHGFHIDSDRSIWKYREWVINAFNRNQPFDKFTTEQLAGDMLPNPTAEQKIASGYVRCNMSTGEGGAIEDEYKAKYTFDRVETTSTIWLGLTMTCARCHSHKYDPIAQREYYELYAFFNNLNESVMDGNKPNPDPFIKVPSKGQTERLAWLKEQIDNGQKKLDEPMPELDRAQVAWRKNWHDKLNSGWTVLSPEAAKSISTNAGAELQISPDKTILAAGANPDTDVYEISGRVATETLSVIRLEALPHESLPNKGSGRGDDGRFRLGEFEAELVSPDKPGEPQKLKFARAVADAQEEKFEVDKAIDGKADTGWGVQTNAASQPHTALFVLSEPVKVAKDATLRLRLRFDASTSKRALGHFRLATASGTELLEVLNPPKFESWQVVGPLKPLADAKASFATEYEPEKEIDLKKSYSGVREDVKWEAKGDFADGKANLLVQDLHGIHGVRYLYRTLTVPSDRKLEVSLRADGLFKLWVNGQVVLERDHPEKVGESPAKAMVDLKKGENKFLAKIVTVQGESRFTFNQRTGDAENLPADIAGILATTGEPVAGDAIKVRTFYRQQHSADFKKLFDEVALWRQENEAIENAIPTTMVAREMDKPRETVMLVRGDYDKKGDKVEPGVPSVLPPLPKDAPKNRLGLAQWLMDPSHPLTARVNVNRFWQQYFGVGLVKTVEDFGVQGEPPSHPELLDWLATEFIRTGWDLKQMQRLVVTSATYRQSSRGSPQLRARDPENRLLARGPRFRMDAEMVRDNALFVSGLLVDKIGGKSVKPYEPPGLWEAVSYNNSQKYVPDTGEAEYRRSIYTYWKRQSPPPNMVLFDAPSREYCSVRRSRANTPLQALALLNDPQFVEASRALAQRMMVEGGKDAEGRIAYGFRLAAGRAPAKDEIRLLLDVYKAQAEDFRKDEAAAEKLLSVGDSKSKGDLNKSELAAWAIVASMILNLDETLTKG